MASYKILFRKNAEKELRQIPFSYLKKVIEKIRSLSNNPRPHGIQMLKVEDRYCRIRQGDWRVIYEVNDSSREVIIIKIGHRREVHN